MRVKVTSRSQEPQERHKLTVAERHGLEAKKRDLEVQLSKTRASDGFSPAKGFMQDAGKLEVELQKVSVQLSADSDLTAKGRMKDRLNSRKKELEDILLKRVSKLTLSNPKAGTIEFDNAMKAAWEATEPEVTRIANEYKDICLRLEPDNPTAGSVPKLVEKRGL